MNYARISQLYSYLDVEYKKIPANKARIEEINYWLGRELGGTPPKPVEGSFWHIFDKFFPLPANWKIYITSGLGAFIAFNTQLHVVPQNIQDALLAVAVSLGFWAVNSTQNLNLVKMKQHLNTLIKK